MKQSPMMEQHARIKQELAKGGNDSLLAVRLGDFYEFFGNDAKVASDALKLMLTKRNDVDMAGIPYHASQKYFAELVSKGHKVAVFDPFKS